MWNLLDFMVKQMNSETTVYQGLPSFFIFRTKTTGSWKAKVGKSPQNFPDPTAYSPPKKKTFVSKLGEVEFRNGSGEIYLNRTSHGG